MITQSGSRLRAGIARIGALALTVTMLAAAPASAAPPAACRVRDLDTGITRHSLQEAVVAASPGDRLTVKGTCHGLTTIDKSLHITGIGTVTSGRSILDGDDLGTVVEVKSGVTVGVKDLTIREGSDPGMDGLGGGVINWGTLNLRDVIVRGNTATNWGGGIFNSGTLTLNGSSSVRGNTATNWGGGIFNSGTLTLNDSSLVRGNTAGGGGGVLNQGTLTLNDATTIRHNTAGGGGGVHNDSGTLTLNDSSSIRGNTATDWGGGGIYGIGGTLVGVICAPAPDANVLNNTPDDCHGSRGRHGDRAREAAGSHAGGLVRRAS